MANKDKIEVRFVGENAAGVTGSCIWVKTPHVEFLIECGLYQGSGNTLDEYKINNAPSPSSRRIFPTCLPAIITVTTFCGSRFFVSGVRGRR